MKRLVIPCIAIAGASAWAMVAMPAGAQDYVGNQIAAQQEQRMLENMQDNVQGRKKQAPRRQDAAAGKKQDAPGTRASAAALAPYAFAPSPMVSRRVNASVAAVLSGGTGSTDASVRLLAPAAQREPAFRTLLAAQLGRNHDAMLARLQAGDLQRSFRKGIARYGYSDRNLADVNNAYLLHAWALVNDRDIDGPRPYAAQRASFIQGSRGGAPVSGDATKQEIAETLALVVMLSGNAWNAADASERRTLRTGLLAMGRSLGMDLSTARLTEDGLVTR